MTLLVVHKYRAFRYLIYFNRFTRLILPNSDD